MFLKLFGIATLCFGTLIAGANEVNHRILLGSYGANDLMILGKDNQIEWRMPKLQKLTDVHYLPNGNLIYAHTSGITEIKPYYDKGTGGKTVFAWEVPKQSELTDKQGITTKQEMGETHSCQVLENGKILAGVSYDGTSYVLEIDKSGTVHKKIVLETYGRRHGSFRNIRKTSQGTYLVTRNGKPLVGLEIDGEGKTLREFKNGRYTMVRLPNGNTLIAGADAHAFFEIDPQGKKVWEVAEKDIDGISLAAVCGLQRLPNGNTLVSLWGGHGNLPGPAAIEVTRDKKLVWKTPDFVKNRVISLQVLDKDVLSQNTLR